MPFNEALFWVGLTALGTGLFVLFEATVKRLYSIGMTAIGVLACAYSVYHHDHPESPAIHAWVILLSLTWAFLGYAAYLRLSQRQRSAPTMEQNDLARVNPSNDEQVRRINEANLDEVRRQEMQAKSDLIRAQQICEEEKRDYANRCLEYRAELARYSELFTPLQIEAFTLAKELRDFLASLPPFPIDPQQHHGESDYDYIVRVNNAEPLKRPFEEQREKQRQWRLKLFHGYANRKFGERITALMHRAGEELEYPAYVPDFAEKPPYGVDDIRKLAQQMEMVGIWINRKERNEVDLLHPKP